ncbi:MAG: polyphosphate kinase 1 [Syntrophomonadaceae bacterium]|nr:polyphosphate kinase 1 [Syntrophomonadaceae bacterium]
MGKKADFLTKHFINRELSWLEFNQRVLEEAQEAGNPLFERLKFAAIVSSNLDEFFMVRVAAIHDQISAGINSADYSGLVPQNKLELIQARVHALVENQYNCYRYALLPMLKKEKLVLVKPKDLTAKQKDYVKQYYEQNIFPLLTPLMVDENRPFPLLHNKSINIGVLMESSQGLSYATLELPPLLDRLVEIPAESGKRGFILVEEIANLYIKKLFKGYHILSTGFYRIIRNADLGLEEDAEDILQTIQQSLKRRKSGSVIRLEVDHNFDPQMLAMLQSQLEVSLNSTYPANGPLDLTFLMKMANLPGYDHLLFESFEPRANPLLTENPDVFGTISRQDVLLHHPYDSFDAVTNFVCQAASDPQVLAIKATFYRLSSHSPLVEALTKAAEGGKQVTVIIEIKARFDEENNISWAGRLEKAGCNVIYAPMGIKVHCKMLLVVRREESGIKRYVHLSTGNYNEVTARLYVDLGYLTANPYLSADAAAVFNMLTSYSEMGKTYKMAISPHNLRKTIISLIDQERENALQGQSARIVAKVNSLVDLQIIEALYRASQAGVSIDLIVRGMCALRPGIKGVSDNIRVRSIVGRFLEHSRVLLVHNSGKEQIYISSADWMERNMDRRVEILFPIESKDIRNKVKTILEIYLQDTVNARILNSDGSYRPVDKRGKKSIDSQAIFARNDPLRD